MSEQHTPGPWCISEAGNSFEIIQDCWGNDGDHLGEVVVRAPEIDPENGGIRNKADAILIAAAPDLLAALQEVTMVLDRIFGVEGREPDAESISGRARAAIAKATAQQ